MTEIKTKKAKERYQDRLEELEEEAEAIENGEEPQMSIEAPVYGSDAF
jgi:exonuclease VII small subunit